ncbi:MAG: SpoVR family protein [Acidobacteriota bacterium]
MSVLRADLHQLSEEIKGYALEYGLDFIPVNFELVDYRQMNQIAACSGFPTRYPHWSFGMEFEQLIKGHTYGLRKIYEMVINNNPSYAFLLLGNTMVDHKTVMAHVFAHSDFFKNNLWFSKTNRKMIDEMANHATRVHRYIEKHGFQKVENFLDTCLSIENLIDPHSPFIVRERVTDQDSEDQEAPVVVKRIQSKEYMTDYVNPPEFLERQKKLLEESRKRKKRFPQNLTQDILKFMLENSPLENWQRDILSIVREESYYFVPQRQTKIMNEGWATYWHSKIMTERCLTDADVIDYADHHSGTLFTQPGRLNPYKLGVELYRHIEERWNKGRFGKEYDDCEDLREKANWDRRLNQGREKIFEVRKFCNDVTFIDTYMTEEFCREHKLFAYEYNPKTGQYLITERGFRTIKAKLLFQLTNFGLPFIFVEDGNYRNRGELLLRHRYDGVELHWNYAKDTLRNLYKLWKRPVNLATVIHGKGKIVTFDGEEFQESETRAHQVA